MTGERARLFVALELPEGVRSELVRWREDALADARGLRLVEPDNLHVTLCFLGWRGVGEVDRIAAACRTAQPLALEGLALDGARWLPKRRPRVLAVAVDDPAGTLASAQDGIARALEQDGSYEREARAFLGHVTVARVRSGIRLGQVTPAAPSPMSLDGARVVLYRSRLMRGGAQYEALSVVS